MHHKISIWSSDGETALDENQTPAISFDESGLAMMRRILRLPEELMANLLDQISDPGQKFQYQMILA